MILYNNFLSIEILYMWTEKDGYFAQKKGKENILRGKDLLAAHSLKKNSMFGMQ